MISPYMARLQVVDFRVRSQRTWHLAQVQHYYRAQIERIQTLRRHIAKIGDANEREVCEGSLTLARTAGSLAMRSLMVYVRWVMAYDPPQRPVVGQDANLDILYRCIDLALQEVRQAHLLLDQTFELVAESIC